MKIHILSDLHNEFSIFDHIETGADVVVLAGDIALGNQGVYWARQAFPSVPIIYVPGNHEFYGTPRRPETLRLLRIAGQQNDVQVLDRNEWRLNGVRFLGATLWTDFRLFGDDKKVHAIMAGKKALNDFRSIEEADGIPFSPARAIELHEQSLAWLRGKLSEHFEGETVVVTHHLPSINSVPARYKHDLLSACFASELDHLFGKMRLWIHGHTHDSLDYVANGTRIVCNPRGYVTSRHTQNSTFSPAKVIEV